MKGAKPQIEEYLAAHGGPFYGLQRELGLLRENAFCAKPRALLFVVFAWGIPAALSIFEGHVFGSLASRPFFLDPGPAARFLVAVGIFILMELQVERHLRTHLNQFVRVPLLAQSSFPEAAKIVAQALRRRDSQLAELTCLLLAAILSLAAFLSVPPDFNSWRASVKEGSASLTLTGWWCLLVSAPIFWFLLLRWLWRHCVWGMLVRKIATRELRLSALHPEKHGGIRFIGQYPNVYTGITFVS